MNRRDFLRRGGCGIICGVAAGSLVSATSCRTHTQDQAKATRDIVMDSHTHLFPPGMDKVGTAEMLISRMDLYGIDKAVILGIYPRVKNEFIARQGRLYPKRFIHLASVNPNDRQVAVNMLERCVRQDGAKGVKLHPQMQKFRADDISLLEPLMRKIEQLKIPVLMHTWAWPDKPDTDSSPRRIIRLASRFPAVTFIAAHCGGMCFTDLLPISRRKQTGRLNNLYVDLSSIALKVPEDKRLLLSETVEKIGWDRVLMGSDFPDYSISEVMCATRNLCSDANGIKLVMGGNAARLYGVK
jgi:hypothetical protein